MVGFLEVIERKVGLVLLKLNHKTLFTLESYYRILSVPTLLCCFKILFLLSYTYI